MVAMAVQRMPTPAVVVVLAASVLRRQAPQVVTVAQDCLTLSLGHLSIMRVVVVEAVMRRIIRGARLRVVVLAVGLLLVVWLGRMGVAVAVVAQAVPVTALTAATVS